MGALGLGWHIGGLHSIGRSSRNIFHDGAVNPVEMTNNDPFILDGNRIIPVSGLNGANNTVYSTEQNMFYKITSFNSIGNGPEWFKVETKDGLTMEFGNTSDSRLIPNSNTVLEWKLNKIYDVFGNYILFEYYNTNGEVTIKEIRYTGNTSAGISPYNSILFYYNELEEKNTFYEEGGEVRQKSLLRQIVIKTENTFVKQYDFSYTNYFNNSYLTEVKFKGSDYSNLNSLLLSYQNDLGLPVNQSATNIGINPLGGNPNRLYQLIDYDGDGKKDLIAFEGSIVPSTSCNCTLFGWQQWRTYKNLGNSNYMVTSPAGGLFFPSGFTYTDVFPLSSKTLGFSNFLAYDFNGDNKEDLLLTTITGNTITFHIYLALSNGTGFSNTQNAQMFFTLPCTPSSGGSCFNFWVLDANGDQLLDLMCGDSSGKLSLWLDVANGSNLKTLVTSGSGLLNFMNGTPMDFDGDGKTELIVKESAVTAFRKISYNTLTGQLTNTSLSSTNSGFLQNINYTAPAINPSALCPYSAFLKLEGDYNGDNKTDYIFATPGPPSNPSYTWAISFNIGNGNHTSPVQLNTSALGLQPHNCNQYYLTHDMNGDGKTDILEFGSTQIKVYFSKGNNGSDYFSYESYPYPSGFPFRKDEIEFSDIDGNGVDDIFFSNSGSPSIAPVIMYFYKGAKSKQIKEIIDAFGNKTEFVFKPLSNNPSYTQNSAKIYPVSNLGFPLYVVDEVKKSDGIGGTNSILYSYENAFMHKQGKGFIGFNKITTTDLTQNFRQIDEYSYNSTNFNLILTKSSKFIHSTNTLLEDAVITNQNQLQSAQSYWPVITKIIKTNYLRNFPTEYDFTYDLNGNLIYQKINTNNVMDIDETFFNGFVSNGSWLPSKPASIQRKITRPGNPIYSRIKSFNYNSNGTIQKETFDPSSPKSVEVTYVYDPNTGVPISKTSASTSLPTKTWQYIYDPKNRVVVKEFNPLNQATEQQYNFIVEKPIVTKDVQNLSTITAYDGYNRPLSIKTPDGLVTTFSYQWVTPGDFIGGDPLNVNTCLYKIREEKPGVAKNITYFDMMSRVVREEEDGFNNSIFSMINYDSRGNIIQQTGPYQIFSGNTFSPLITTNIYDNLNNLAQSNTTDGNKTNNTSYSYSYNNGDITITTTSPDSKISSVTNDATGLLKAAADNGGNITYSYYSNRKVKDINVNGNLANYFEYDQYSRQTKLQDRDAGITLYDYNGYGELTSQTDANNKTYSYAYDQLGRYIQKSGPGELYTYQYVTSGNGLNKLEQITALNGYNTKLYYDNVSRLNKVEENIDGQPYATEYIYDNFNRIEKIKYPSSFSIKNEFNSNGYTKKIKNEVTGQTIWECLEMNPFGEVSSYLSGNNIQTQKIYTNFSLPNQFNSPGVQVLIFDFDEKNANLKNRNDAILSKTEAFSFDNLNRLQQAQVTSLPSLSLNYNLNGNILTKTNIGTFTYKTNKPDAVDEITNPNQVISLNQQDVTYTSFNKVKTIIEDVYQYDIVYGADMQRKKSVLYNNSNLSQTRYYIGDYEKTVQGSTTQEVHYIKTPSGLDAIYVITNGVGAIYYTYADYLGTINKATDASGNIVADLNYDAWGRRRNNATWDYSSPSNPPSWLYRGYTGHEHLPEFELINMNGRMYDPILGMMLSPDENNQNYKFSQNFNRYSYAYNNPLKFTDPTGNLLLTATIGFLKGVFYSIQSKEGVQNWFSSGITQTKRTVRNSYKVMEGLFVTDNDKLGWEQAKQLVSRFTYEAPQTTVGFIWTLAGATFGNMDNVEFYHGATVTYGGAVNGQKYDGFTLGSFINLRGHGDGMEIGTGNNSRTLMHEYGHYLQSQEYGNLYLTKIGSQTRRSDWPEMDANYRSAQYFAYNTRNSDNPFDWNRDIAQYNSGTRYVRLPNKKTSPSLIEYTLFNGTWGPALWYSANYK